MITNKHKIVCDQRLEHIIVEQIKALEAKRMIKI